MLKSFKNPWGGCSGIPVPWGREMVTKFTGTSSLNGVNTSWKTLVFSPSFCLKGSFLTLQSHHQLCWWGLTTHLRIFGPFWQSSWDSFTFFRFGYHEWFAVIVQCNSFIWILLLLLQHSWFHLKLFLFPKLTPLNCVLLNYSLFKLFQSFHFNNFLLRKV